MSVLKRTASWLGWSYWFFWILLNAAAFSFWQRQLGKCRLESKTWECSGNRGLHSVHFYVLYIWLSFTSRYSNLESSIMVFFWTNIGNLLPVLYGCMHDGLLEWSMIGKGAGFFEISIFWKWNRSCLFLAIALLRLFLNFLLLPYVILYVVTFKLRGGDKPVWSNH